MNFVCETSLLGCASQEGDLEMMLDDETRRVSDVLDAFHQAASDADLERYFSYFHEDGVFIGTDKVERWTVKAFKDYCEPYFSKGQGWTYQSQRRHVMFAPDGQVAWFDEQLVNDKYGQTRGSGVLMKSGGSWKVSHYVLSFPVPNDVALDVVAIVKSRESGD